MTPCPYDNRTEDGICLRQTHCKPRGVEVMCNKQCEKYRPFLNKEIKSKMTESERIKGGGMKNFETIDELVSQRRGYKYLNEDLTSPYQKFQYDFTSKKIMTTQDLNTNIDVICGSGWNLATMDWICGECNIFKKKIVEFTIPKSAVIVVPHNSSGKFRTDKIKFKRIVNIEKEIPFLKNFKKRIKKYVPVNPIVADEMPDKKKIKEIMDRVEASVGDSSVAARVWDKVEASVLARVGVSSVWARVWSRVGARVGDFVLASVTASLEGSSVWASVSVWDYSYICGYYAIVKFCNLNYRHPVFDLIDMGVLVIDLKDKYSVFGRNGKHLGDIENDRN